MTSTVQRLCRMGIRRRAANGTLALAILLLSPVVTTLSAQAQTLTVLYSFKGGADGVQPYAGLLRDAAGNLYGTTYSGGAPCNCGTVFKLDATGKETVLHSFAGGDGQGPAAGLIRDAAGNLYGTTQYGGASGGGTVFKLDATGKETVLYSFTAGADGALPFSRLVRDAAGNLYGTTYFGDFCNCGTVFKLDATGKETVLHSFAGRDGQNPYAGLVRGAAGNLYGTTAVGGASGQGTVVGLNAAGKFKVLHSFAGADGANPYAGLVRDAAGNLYGATQVGGSSNNCSRGCGTVFKLDTTGAETVLYSFTGPPDGQYPFASLVRDAAGNLYGATFEGGASGKGTVFKLDATGKETVLHSFAGADGAYPVIVGGLARDAAGNLYGTTQYGGASDSGTVFKLAP